MEIKLNEKEALEYLQYKANIKNNSFDQKNELNESIEKYQNLNSSYEHLYNKYQELSNQYQDVINMGNKFSNENTENKLKLEQYTNLGNVIDFERALEYCLGDFCNSNELSDELVQYRDIATPKQLISLLDLVKSNAFNCGVNNLLYNALYFDSTLKNIDNKDSYIYKILYENNITE